jgi:large subunit ribosomal protein L24e
MLFDSTLEFEQRRDVPLRYNRETYVKTIMAIQRIENIKERREQTFWENRMKAAKEKNKDALERELAKHIHLVSNPSLVEKVKLRQRVNDIEEEENNTMEENFIEETKVNS